MDKDVQERGNRQLSVADICPQANLCMLARSIPGILRFTAEHDLQSLLRSFTI